MNITFTPTSIGNLSGSLSITDNAPGSPQAVSLAGVSTEVKFNPSSLHFHTCTSAQAQTKVTNVGSSALSISNIGIAGSSNFTQTNNCGSSVAPGGFCTITVTFKYAGGGMTHTGDVSISDNGGTSPQQVGMTGRCGP